MTRVAVLCSELGGVLYKPVVLPRWMPSLLTPPPVYVASLWTGVVNVHNMGMAMYRLYTTSTGSFFRTLLASIGVLRFIVSLLFYLIQWGWSTLLQLSNAAYLSLFTSSDCFRFTSYPHSKCFGSLQSVLAMMPAAEICGLLSICSAHERGFLYCFILKYH
jgi:hypothetical protein